MRTSAVSAVLAFCYSLTSQPAAIATARFRVGARLELLANILDHPTALCLQHLGRPSSIPEAIPRGPTCVVPTVPQGQHACILSQSKESCIWPAARKHSNRAIGRRFLVQLCALAAALRSPGCGNWGAGDDLIMLLPPRRRPLALRQSHGRQTLRAHAAVLVTHRGGGTS